MHTANRAIKKKETHQKKKKRDDRCADFILLDLKYENVSRKIVISVYISILFNGGIRTKIHEIFLYMRLHNRVSGIKITFKYPYTNFCNF